MAGKGLRFRVFKAGVVSPEWYAAIVIGDEAFFMSPGYSLESSAFHTCEMTWLALGNYGPAPYARDSLKPAGFVDSIRGPRS